MSTNHKKVLVTEPVHQCGISLLEARDDIEVIHAPDKSAETLLAMIGDVHAVLARSANLTGNILATAPNLEIVSRHGVGCDTVDVAYMSGRGLPVAIASGANSRSVAEHTMMFMLAVARSLPTLDKLVRENRWSDRDGMRALDLHGSKILIIGFGRIGRIVAELCNGFGMDITVADIALDRDLAEAMGCKGVTDFHSELAKADIVTIHVPLDDSTRHILGADEFAAMKDGAILINCARGGVVDEAALVDALDSKKLRGAGIDVFSSEPPPADHPLTSRDDVVMAPHNGAASVLSAEAMSSMAAQNIIDHFDGRLRDDCTFNLEALKPS